MYVPYSLSLSLSGLAHSNGRRIESESESEWSRVIICVLSARRRTNRIYGQYTRSHIIYSSHRLHSFLASSSAHCRYISSAFFLFVITVPDSVSFFFAAADAVAAATSTCRSS